jgi:hypothetical protein
MFAGCRVLIRIASWILPRPERPGWVREWEGAARNWESFLLDRDGPQPVTYARVVWACCRVFPDAFRRRFSRESVGRAVRGPAFVFIAAAVAFLAVALSSAGFSGLRRLLTPLPFPEPDRLVAIGQTAFGVPFGIQSYCVPVWQKESKLASGLAMYTLRPGRAAVGTNFFDVLGARPLLGRTFRPGDESALPSRAVITYSVWRRDFASDPSVIGRTVSIDDRMMTVVGVLQPGFRALVSDPGYFTPLEPRLAPWMVGVIGRLKPGVDAGRLRAELLAINSAQKVRVFHLASRMRLLPLERPLATRFAAYGAALLMGLVLAAALIVIERLRLSAGWRYWSFLGGKIAVWLGIVIAVWIEIAAAVPMEFITGLAFNWAFFVLCACTVYWGFHDQRRRCPVCLMRLALPVTIGSWSSSLLEPVSTEFLCERGHGALCIPETQSSVAEPDSWTAMDDTWRELFTR